MTVQRFAKVSLVLVLTTFLGGTVLADEGTQPQYQHSNHNRHGDDAQFMADHVSAVAALEPIGAVEGWGRAMVRDQLLPDGDSRRFVAFRVVGLDPDSEYEARVVSVVDTADTEILVGVIATDAAGDGVLRLGWPEEYFPPVPGDVPSADSLSLARVYDASLGLALEGEFVYDWFGGTGPTDIVHLERIDLEPDIDPDAKGVAKVYRTEDDTQTFETRACRLEPNASYQVMLGKEGEETVAGVVTTDGVGHGELVLTTADGSLPTALQPIEELRYVGWVDSEGDVVLSGTLTGENSAGGHGGGVPPGNRHGETGGNGNHGGGGHGGNP